MDCLRAVDVQALEESYYTVASSIHERSLIHGRIKLILFDVISENNNSVK